MSILKDICLYCLSTSCSGFICSQFHSPLHTILLYEGNTTEISDIIPRIIRYQLYGIILVGFTAFLVKLAIKRNCAPYGMKPCIIHENMSMNEAVLLGSIFYFSEFSLAISPVTIIATVLLAVAASVKAANAAIPTDADLGPFNSLLVLSIIHLRPP